MQVRSPVMDRLATIESCRLAAVSGGADDRAKARMLEDAIRSHLHDDYPKISIGRPWFGGAYLETGTARVRLGAANGARYHAICAATGVAPVLGKIGEVECFSFRQTRPARS